MQKNHLFIGLGGQGGCSLGELRKVMAQRAKDTESLQQQGVRAGFLAIDSSDDVRNQKRTWTDFGIDLARLANVDAERAKAVSEFFKVCYARFSHSTSDNWLGLALPGSRSLCNRDYKDAFRRGYPTSVVCPYCDGEIGTPQLDHYLAKSAFPLLACSPHNLVPVCPSCNDAIAAKGDRLAIILEQLVDHQEYRGREASTMVKAAVCQAVLDRRPGYLEELEDFNEPRLVLDPF